MSSLSKDGVSDKDSYMENSIVEWIANIQNKAGGFKTISQIKVGECKIKF